MSLYQEGFTQNREISWLKYNERVLEEALDNSVPLFERLKYIAIFDANLEEFFQVRIGSLIEEKKTGEERIDEKSGLSAKEQLMAVNQYIRDLLKNKDKVYELVEAKLKNAGMFRASFDNLTEEENIKVKTFYVNNIKNRLKPFIIKTIDDIRNIDENFIHIAAKFASAIDYQYGIVNIPNDLPHIFMLEYSISGNARMKYILVEDIIKHYIDDLFFPYCALEVCSIDIARNAEVYSDSKLDPIVSMKDIVKKRKFSDPDKLLCDKNMSDEMKSFFLRNFNLSEEQLYVTKRVSLNYIYEVEKNLPEQFINELCFKKFKPFDQTKLLKNSMIEHVKRKDYISCYPYDSFNPFLKLLKESAISPDVEEIRISIYRLSSHPQIINYLIDAARNGKRVDVLIELRARFDEEKNIFWAEKLKNSGCNVNYGSDKYKVHSKICQIVLRNEKGKKKYITQMSTGNYNEKTSLLYTDISLITYNQSIGKSVSLFWKDINNKKYGKYDDILTSPKNMKKTILKLIDRESQKGINGRIFFKVNSLSDRDIIEAIMNASCSGCKINMIVRGICCLIPGVSFCTDNVTIVNVVGRFLEHSRVYIFGKGKDEIMYISSADMMTRNLEKRVELACPIYNKEIRNTIRTIMYLNFNDNVKGRIIDNKGNYRRKKSSSKIIDSQSMLMNSNY